MAVQVWLPGSRQEGLRSRETMCSHYAQPGHVTQSREGLAHGEARNGTAELGMVRSKCEDNIPLRSYGHDGRSWWA